MTVTPPLGAHCAPIYRSPVTSTDSPRPTPSTDPVESFVALAAWRFARTMWKWPHWYVLEKWHPEHRAAFRELARRIVEEGKEEYWAGTAEYPCSPRVDRYYVIGAYKYWAWPNAEPNEIDLINRARLDGKGPAEGTKP